MVDAAQVPDCDKRAELLKTAYDLCREPVSKGMLDVAVEKTAYLTVPQLKSIVGHVGSTEQKPGTPTLKAIMASADSASRTARAQREAGNEAWCVPTVTIDWHRKESQEKILMAWKKPASSAHWDTHELAALRAELEQDSPALAKLNAKIRFEKGFFAKNKRFPDALELTEAGHK